MKTQNRSSNFFTAVSAFFLLICLSFNQSHAETEVNENPLEVKVIPLKAPVAPGKPVTVQIQLELDKRYHAYEDMFKFIVNEPAGVSDAKFTVSPVLEFEDKFAKKKKRGIHERAEMTGTFTLPAQTPLGTLLIKADVGFQACADDHCLFPKKIPIEFKVKVVDRGANFGDTAGSGVTNSSGQFDVQSALEKGLIYALLLAFGFGVLTSLTPCIFPMIPITLSIIGARSLGQSRLKSFTLSIFYVLGIALTYSIMGVAAARAGSMFGSALGNVYVVSGIAILFVVMALSMYGAFEFQIPAFIRDRLGNKKTGTGFFGAFLAGILAGVVASPCVGPVLVSILTFVAKTQNSELGFMLLFSYALGLGMLFIVLGTFSGLINTLPRGGSWMEIVKFIFGTTMIGMAIYYLQPVVSTNISYGLTGLALVLISSFYGAFIPNDKAIGKIALQKGLMLTSLFVGAAFIVAALGILSGAGTIGAGTPASGSSVEVAKDESHLSWVKFSKEKLLEAHQKGLPVIVDFWAEWCVACKELEKFTFTDPAVRAESANFMLLKVDATTETDELLALKKEYSVVGLPTLLFFAPSGDQRTDLTLTGFESATDFHKRMLKVKN